MCGYVYTWVTLCTPLPRRDHKRPEGIRFPGTRGPGDCDPQYIDAGSQTQALRKRS